MGNLLAKINIGEEFWIKTNTAIKGPCTHRLPNGDCAAWGSSTYSSIGAFISAVLPNVYIFAGIILFILMLVGGLIVIAGASKGEPESLEKGKKAITAALIGFLIIFTSYWIIQIIETITGIAIFKTDL